MIYKLFMLLGLLSILYGIMVFAAGSGTGFFLVWIAIGLCLELVLLAERKGCFDHLPDAVKLIALGILSMGILAMILTVAAISTSFGSQGEPDSDYVIVLGAQVNSDGPCRALRERLDAAAKYLDKNPESICIVSGGQGFNEPTSEAFAMKNYLLGKGIDGDRILMEDESGSTEENLRLSRRLMDSEDSSVCLVTNNFHLFRSLKVAERAGLSRISGIAAPSSDTFLPNNLLREVLALWKSLLSGQIRL